MDIVPTTYYENLKRYWRRRRYQRLNDGTTNNRRKMKVMKLGGNTNNNTTTTNTRRHRKIRQVKKLRLKICSPLRLLVKLHDAYINMMIRLTKNMGNSNNVGVFGGKRVPKGRQVTMISSCEEVDARLVLEIYNRMVSTRQLTAY